MDWKSEYSIGIPEIDAQHRQLLECIDRLETAADEHQRELSVYFVLEELTDYSRVTFAVEEIVMRLFDYPGLEAHAAEHRKFSERLQSMEKAELQIHDMHTQVSTYLREWLTRHIMISDKQCAAYLLGQGASPRG